MLSEVQNVYFCLVFVQDGSLHVFVCMCMYAKSGYTSVCLCVGGGVCECVCVRVCIQSVSEEEEVPVEELSSEEEEELPLKRLAPPPEDPPPAAFCSSFLCFFCRQDFT